MKKIFVTLALILSMTLCTGIGFITMFDSGFENSTAVYASADAYYEVDSVEIHPHSFTNSKLYMLLSMSDGAPALTGYAEWRASDPATAALKDQLLINGKKPGDEVVLQYMDIENAFCLSGYYLTDGSTIVIPSGATFDNGLSSMKFVRDFTITWNEGEDGNGSYSVTRTKAEIIVPKYEMEEGMLSDFTQNAALRLGGMSYQEAAVNNPGDCWLTDYQSTKVSGRYLTAADAPEGSVNGVYEMAWEEMATLLYPSIMFMFPQDVAFEPDDELVIRLYLSESIDMSFELWVTSSLTKNVWDPQSRFSGATLSKGKWIELHLAAKDYADENGKIAPIAFTFHYTALATTPAAKIYFDTARFVGVEKTLDDDYKKQDISEIIPLGEGKAFIGEGDGEDTFDFTAETNVKFARKDVSVNAVKMMITISDLSDFNIYFVLNGTGLYYNNGGAYFWLSNRGVNMGYAGKSFGIEALPAGITAGTAFELELREIPYYVNGMKAGYFVQTLINGEEVGESGYISSTNCPFGTWFGFYMHNTTDAVTVNLAPVAASESASVELSLKAQMNVTQIEADGYVKLETKLIGNFLNQSEITYEIVSGGEYASLDEDHYLNAIKDGEVVVVAKVTNEFGTFTSNELKIIVGNGAQSKGGCSGTVSGFGCGALALLVGAVVVLKKKKEN